MRVLTVIGARPQFIKAAAVSRVFAATDGIEEVLVHTGQHHDAGMSDIFFEELGIPQPAHYLGIAGGGHGAMTGRMLEALERVFLDEAPDWVLVYGDTNSTLAGALSAAKLNIAIAHVEAGLRSFNRRMPEEINRILTDHCSALLFTPTATATANLANEGVPGERIEEVGDVMFDAVRLFGTLAAERESADDTARFASGEYVLVTVHRQENTDDPVRLAAIVDGLAQVAERMPVVLPLHPRTRKSLAAGGLDQRLGKVSVIDPVGYLAMVRLQQGAAVIATDSGGVQKEAFFHAVPCVTLRDETEWTELVEHGWNRLVPPTGADAIAREIRAAAGRPGREVSPYGKGDAAERIVQCLLNCNSNGS